MSNSIRDVEIPQGPISILILDHFGLSFWLLGSGEEFGRLEESCSKH